MYLVDVGTVTRDPTFSWAPVQAKRFVDEQTARTYVAGAGKFPGDYEIIDDPVRDR